jgi:BTB/POZ domain
MQQSQTEEIETVLAQTEQLQQQAARLGYQLIVQADSATAVLLKRDTVDACGTEHAVLTELPVDAAEALVGNPQHSDRALQIGDKVWPVHSSLLTCRSDFFRALLGSGFAEQQQAVVTAQLPSTEHKSVEILLKFLYTGVVPTAFDSCNQAIAVAYNAHYVSADPLYTAAVQYMARHWRRYESTAAVSSMSIALMEDVLAQLQADDITLKVKLMAAVWSTTTVDNDTMRVAVSKLVTHTDFERFLTHDILKKLHNSSDKSISRVLDVVPTAVIFTVLDTVISTQQQILREHENIVTCRTCKRKLTLYLADHDPDGCLVRVHSGKYVCGSGWTCCKALYKKTVGCSIDENDHHTV